MPTYYVEDYDGDRNEDAVEPVVLSPVVDQPRVRAKVVEAEQKPAPKKSSRASTKG
jgi:hypothetical protein